MPADMQEIVERLARLEEKADTQKKDMEEVKESIKEMQKKVSRLNSMVYVLWVVGTAGVGVLLEILRSKVKAVFGGHA